MEHLRKKRPSEAIGHDFYRHSSSKNQKTPMTGLEDRHREADRRMQELYRTENSYGNVAVGFNEKKEAAVVFSQKREQDGPATREEQKKLHTIRETRKADPQGSLRFNPNMRQEGAVAFYGYARMPGKKLMPKLQNIWDSTQSGMMEKRMPFLALERTRMREKELERIGRTEREQGNSEKAEGLERNRQQVQQRRMELEQEKRTIQKKLQKAWEQAEKQVREKDAPLRSFLTDGLEKKREEDGLEDVVTGTETDI